MKPIEKIKAGDKVLSWDEQGRRYEYKRVVRTFEHRAQRLASVRIDGEREPVVATPEHPFYVRAHDGLEGYEGASDVSSLQPSDELCPDCLAAVFSCLAQGPPSLRSQTL